MPRKPGPKREFFIAIVSTFVAVMGALQQIGEPARAVHVIMIFAGGLGAGVGIARAVERIRATRRENAATAGSARPTGSEGT